MPSVGMRRTTRVFGVVKGIDGARVLRSGRRLLPESDEVKVKKTVKNDEGWLLNVENKRSIHTGTRSNRHNNHGARDKCANRRVVGARDKCAKRRVDGARHKCAGWSYDDDGDDCSDGSVGLEHKAVPMEVEDSKCDQVDVGKIGSLNDLSENVRDTMCGLVYSRKRKRQHLEGDRNLPEKKITGGSVLWGCKRREARSLVVVKSSGREVGFLLQDSPHCLVLGLSVGDYAIQSGSYRIIAFADLLFSVLSYLRKMGVSLPQLFRFLISNPISGVYCSHGIRLLPDTPTNSSGICKIFGAQQLTPLFSVEFSAVPFCFMFMHSSMLLRCRFTPSIYVYYLVNENVSGIEFSAERYFRECKLLASEGDNLWNMSSQHQLVNSSKVFSRTAAYKNGVYSRGVQKRRSSLRSRRGRNSPLVRRERHNGSLLSDLINGRKTGIPFSSVVHNKLEGSSSAGSFQQPCHYLVGSNLIVDSSCCSASILVIESDRCCREEGASVMLEMSESGEWVLAVKKDGITRYIHKAHKVMRPSSSNRVTHDVVWTADSGWKLEFPTRQDWVTFKFLYRECSNKNVCVSPSVKAIPVPGVREVTGYCDQNIYTYHRPDAYITMKNNEVSRTLARKTASYDMDSEDEEWLNKFNDEFFGADKHSDHLTPEYFELMIDAYEKDHYCCSDGNSDLKVAIMFCSEVGQRDVMEAVHSYWMKKRKEKRRALVRVFQVHQPRRASLIPRPALRKKRSFKRQASQCGSGKQASHLQAMAGGQSQEKQNAIQRAVALKVSAKRSMELAILKRERAQYLMESADLATYRATMALKIAEATQYAESSLDSALSHLL